MRRAKQGGSKRESVVLERKKLRNLFQKEEKLEPWMSLKTKMLRLKCRFDEFPVLALHFDSRKVMKELLILEQMDLRRGGGRTELEREFENSKKFLLSFLYNDATMLLLRTTCAIYTQTKYTTRMHKNARKNAKISNLSVSQNFPSVVRTCDSRALYV